MLTEPSRRLRTETASEARPPLTISVIIAVCNGAPTLQRALDSVFDQTHPHVELIVIDGGSTDGTVDILRRNEARIAYWESSPDTGIYNAWNKALDHVTGDWVCFLGADDWYAGPDVLASVVAAIAEDGAAHSVYYGNMDAYRADDTIYRARDRRWDKARRQRFRRGVMFPHPAAFHRRSLFEEFGRFDESFVIAGDFEFLLRILKSGPGAKFIKLVVVNMTAGGMSQKPSNRIRIAREVYRARYKNGVVRTPPWRSPGLYRTIVRTWVTYRFKPALNGVAATVRRPR